MPSIIVKPVSVPRVRVAQVQTQSVRVTPTTGSGGASLKPAVIKNGNTLTFRLFTLEQMEDVKIFFSDVSTPAKFVVTTDEDDFFLSFSNDSPEGLAGEVVLDDAVEMYTNKWLLNIEVEIPSTFTIYSVYIEGADCNLLEDTQWRFADIRREIDIDTTTLAKEQTLTNALQSVLTALNPKATTNDVTAAKQAILDALSHISPEDPYSQALASFFNITEATEYTALTPAEAIAIARDCQYNVMGTDWPIPTWLPTGVTEAQVESAAEGLGIPYHEPTQTA